MISLGSPAPDLALITQFGEQFRLSDYRGKKNVLILGYPKDWTPICTSELPELNELKTDFERKADTVVVSLSCDSKDSHLSWSGSMPTPIRFPMLADTHPHGAVSRALGLWIPEESITQRGTVIVGKDGRIQFLEIAGKGNRRDLYALLEAAIRVNGGLKPGDTMPEPPAGGATSCSLDNKGGAACALPPAPVAGRALPPPPKPAGQVAPQGPVLFVSDECGHCAMLKSKLRGIDWRSVITMVSVGAGHADGNAIAAQIAPGLKNVPALVEGKNITIATQPVFDRIQQLITQKR